MNKRIAIVDDSPPFCLLVKQLVEMEKNTLDIYTTAGEFLRMPSMVSSYDLIILDINLPGENGLTILKYLKSNLSTMSIPVVLLTADSRKETIITGKQLGAKDFLTKPVDPQQLLERIELALLEDLN